MKTLPRPGQRLYASPRAAARPPLRSSCFPNSGATVGIAAPAETINRDGRAAEKSHTRGCAPTLVEGFAGHLLDEPRTVPKRPQLLVHHRPHTQRSPRRRPAVAACGPSAGAVPGPLPSVRAHAGGRVPNFLPETPAGRCRRRAGLTGHDPTGRSPLAGGGGGRLTDSGCATAQGQRPQPARRPDTGGYPRRRRAPSRSPAAAYHRIVALRKNVRPRSESSDLTGPLSPLESRDASRLAILRTPPARSSPMPSASRHRSVRSCPYHAL